jgi:hypothetical protein
MFAPVIKNDYVPICSRRRAVAIVLLAALTITALVLVKLDPGALCTLPTLVLLVLLALRRYPGERILMVLCEARRQRGQRPRSSVSFAGRPGIAVPRGGLLLACSLAVRPPPTARFAAS